MTRLFIVAAISLALAGVLTFGLLRGPANRDIRSVQIAKEMPDFEMPLFERYKGSYGDSLGTSSQRGVPVIINFWASWCDPCREEAPVLEATWQKYRGRLLILGVDTQDRANLVAAEAFLDEFGLSFPNGRDLDNRIGIDYGLFGVPETFFLDAEGRLVHKHTGQITAEVLEQQIQVLLAAK